MHITKSNSAVIYMLYLDRNTEEFRLWNIPENGLNEISRQDHT
jgi:hypothetical protein